MQTNPESAAVEAVAYITHDDPITTVRRLVTHEEFDSPEDMHLIARVNGWDPLYPQSALDALRGEVAAAERRVAELEANDRRYRFLREKVCIIGAEHLSYTKAVFEFVNLPYPTYIAPSAAYELDAAIDALTKESP